MRTRCPGCGATLSLDALVAHDAAREALAAAFKLSGPLGGMTLRYLSLFRSESRDLSMDRVARLLGEILPDMEAQRISRSGQVHEAPLDAWLWAMTRAVEARDSGHLKLPLKGHGWLYEVLTTWRPAASQQLVAMPGSAPTSRTASKTLSAIAALEERARD